MHTRHFATDLIRLGLELSKFVVGSEGNISQRTKDGFIIKASGKSLRSLDENSFVVCDIDGNTLVGETSKPSMEVGFHSWIYQNSDTKVIAHTHPSNLLKILCTSLAYNFAGKRLFPDQVVFNDVNYCLVPYVTPGASLVSQIKTAAGRYDAFPRIFLLKNHGLVCCAGSVNEAITMTEICEKSAEIFIGAKTLGTVDFLNDHEIKQIQNHDGEIYRQGQQ